MGKFEIGTPRGFMPLQQVDRGRDLLALEVRFQHDPTTLLGWIPKADLPHRDRGSPNWVMNFEQPATDEEGIGLGCSGPSTLIQTRHVQVWFSMSEYLKIKPSIPKYACVKGPSLESDLLRIKSHLSNTYSLLKDHYLMLVTWQFLPVTTDQFEWLFERSDFLPADVDNVIADDLDWRVG